MSIFLAVLLGFAGQDKLPPANPLPLDNSAESAVIAPISALFAAISARNSTEMLAQTRKEGHVTVSVEETGGAHTVRHISWAEYAAHIAPGTARLEQKLGQPAVEIDGDIAMVWAPYSFTVDGKPHHCGTTLFDLLRTDGRWAILNATYTHRTTGC